MEIGTLGRDRSSPGAGSGRGHTLRFLLDNAGHTDKSAGWSWRGYHSPGMGSPSLDTYCRFETTPPIKGHRR